MCKNYGMKHIPQTHRIATILTSKLQKIKTE